MKEVILLTFLITILILIVFPPVYEEPRIIKHVLTPEECDQVIARAEPELKPSTISNNKTIDTKIRSSETAWLDRSDPLIKDVMERCLSYTDKSLKNCENLQVLRYKPGGFYKPHQDAFKHEFNTRVYTCIIALSDDFTGGETEFPNLGKTYKLEKGDMLLFNTLNSWNFMTSKALHGGRSVLSGQKWICNLWIRRGSWVI